jgi:16S rRNA C1402 (ribose-2'-O) methylase RsmI
MTKIHEEFIRGSLDDIIEYLSLNNSDLKGEVVIIVSVEVENIDSKKNSLFAKKDFLKQKRY